MQNAVDMALSDSQCYGLQGSENRMSCFFNKVGMVFLDSYGFPFVCYSICTYTGTCQRAYYYVGGQVVGLTTEHELQALVNVGGDLTKLVPGRVSTEVDARLAYDKRGIVNKVFISSQYQMVFFFFGGF